MTMKDNCLLGTQKASDNREPICQFAGNEHKCTERCPFFVALHGLSGTNGKSGFGNIPLEHRYRTISSSNVRNGQNEAYRLLDLYEASFPRIFEQIEGRKLNPVERIKNLYLWSPSPGTGKTASAAASLNSFLIKYYLGCLKRNIQPVQRPIYFLDINKFQTDYSQMTRTGVPEEIREEAGQRYYAQMEYAKNSLLTVFDDIGIRSVSEALRSDLLDCINHRMSKLYPSIFTSNLPMEELPNIFKEERLFDRIRDLAITIEFEGTSKRGKRT